MGVLDFIYATAHSVSQNSKKHVDNFFSTSYSYGCAAAGQIGNAVQKLNRQLQKEDTRRIAADVAKNTTVFACRYGLKTVLPEELVNIVVPPSAYAVNKLMNLENKELMKLKSELDDHKQEVKELRVVTKKMEKELESLRKDQDHKLERQRKYQNHKKVFR
ncbi:uncharacterized protein LOC119369052 isoform X1 [Jatropha curcas]|uniref:uncharacterized protein LOC119369052 isoform X1 n=1 Tax=Jatropha curcas TaxID=180498 RepID=UPI001892EA6E|nr:uncharacterized protein LOC119369052 isoform X1 [Jatropha curcas]